ncbi:MAG: BspA family leucine-rich repeat surface protein [Saccharospirillaceae bacterium]|nr:BspA family leucine-rich repeat surface protein [Pseudomonadales bacterium]NRB80880.1 BspA family leucine-rich repeat surface protein [Saccharospirillaceae bacterium]
MSFLLQSYLMRILLLTSIFVMTACGGDSQTGNQTGTASEVSVETQTITETETVTTTETKTESETETATETVTQTTTENETNTITLTQVDLVAPVITLIGESEILILQNSVYVDLGATATDDVDAVVEVVVLNEVDSSTVGVYVVSYSAIDVAGNESSSNRTINVIETIPTIIYLTGANVLDLEAGQDYVELGATAINYLGEEVDVVISGDVSIHILGNNIITYSVTDIMGTAMTTRTINVVDSTAPIISLIGDSVIMLDVGDEYIEQGVLINDNVDNDLEVVIVITHGGDEVITSDLGMYRITYQVTDHSNNQSEIIGRTVDISDYTAPVFDHPEITEVTLYLSNVFVPPTATDNNLVYPPRVEAVDMPDLTVPGTYIVTFVAIDNSNLRTEMEMTIHVKEDLPPVITLNAQSEIDLYLGEVLQDLSATALDDKDGVISVIQSGNVDSQTIGEYTLTYLATNSNNQTTEIIQRINVLADEFSTVWKTDNIGVSNNNQITLNTNLIDFPMDYNYAVDWGDGQTDTDITADITHSYAQAGTYTVIITGEYPQIYFPQSNSDAKKLITVKRWGNNSWRSMKQAFAGSHDLVISAQDIPDFTFVKDMSFMFYDAMNFNSDISGWDVSLVEDMSFMFHIAMSFNQDIGGWTVSSAINMGEMFYGAFDFNQDISSWNVSQVTNMSAMFLDVVNFNHDIGSWNVGNVTSMAFMFGSATKFDQDLSAWNVSKVSEMDGMFDGVILSAENYSALLLAWSNQMLKRDVRFNAGFSQYTATLEVEAARDSLSDTYNWTVVDGGPVVEIP